MCAADSKLVCAVRAYVFTIQYSINLQSCIFPPLYVTLSTVPVCAGCCSPALVGVHSEAVLGPTRGVAVAGQGTLRPGDHQVPHGTVL